MSRNRVATVTDEQLIEEWDRITEQGLYDRQELAAVMNRALSEECPACGSAETEKGARTGAGAWGWCAACGVSYITPFWGR